jgi:hypothetical protein
LVHDDLRVTTSTDVNKRRTYDEIDLALATAETGNFGASGVYEDISPTADNSGSELLTEHDEPESEYDYIKSIANEDVSINTE